MQRDYRLSYLNAGVTTDVATGVLAINDTSVGGDIEVSQSNLHFSSESPVGPISANGSQIAWSYPPNAGDSVVVQYRPQGASSWQTETLSGGGPSFTADLSPAGTGPIEFEILYSASGASSPYLEADGVLNSTLATVLTQAPAIDVSQTEDFTSLLPLEGLASDFGVITWTTPLPGGETATFRYQLPDGTWQSVTPVPNGSGFAVDLSQLPPGSYAYEIAYEVPGQGAPTYYAGGTVTVSREVSGGAVSCAANHLMRDCMVA